MHMTGLCRLGRDAELRHLPDGTPVLSMALAYNHGRKDADGKRPTQWVDAALFGERANSLAQYLTKGTAVAVLLEDVRIESYTRRDNTVAHSMRARVVNLEFAGARQESAAAPRQKAAPEKQAPKPSPQACGDEDDIPF